MFEVVKAGSLPTGPFTENDNSPNGLRKPLRLLGPMRGKACQNSLGKYDFDSKFIDTFLRILDPSNH